MKRITVGITRTVYLIGRYAVKVPCGRYTYDHWLRGLLANRQERRWSRYKAPQLLPVIWSDWFGLVVVMPRVPLRSKELEPTEYGIRFADLPVENKAEHFGYYHARLVAVDYGS